MSLSQILIVDNHLTEIQSIKNILSKTSYRIKASSETKNAWELIQQDKPCLIFLVLYNLDSLTFLSRIRNEYTREHLPVITVGQQNEQHALIETLYLGSNDFIVKPYNKAHILSKLESLASLKKSYHNPILSPLPA